MGSRSVLNKAGCTGLTLNSGIVQLEIRRARLGDAGNYMCIATNDLGDATISCDVVVNEAKAPAK